MGEETLVKAVVKLKSVVKVGVQYSLPYNIIITSKKEEMN